MKSEFLETIKIIDGVIYNIEYHQERYEHVLSSFGIKTLSQLQKYINPPSQGLFRCRIVYNIDKILSVTYHPYRKKRVKSLRVIFNDTINYQRVNLLDKE